MEHPRILVVHRRRRFGWVRKLVTATALSLGLADLLRRAIQGPGGRYSYTPKLALQLYAHLSVWMDQRFGWPNFPLPLGLGILLGERIILRWQNLHDTDRKSVV